LQGEGAAHAPVGEADGDVGYEAHGGGDGAEPLGDVGVSLLVISVVEIHEIGL